MWSVTHWLSSLLPSLSGLDDISMHPAMQDLSNSVHNGYLRMCDPIQKVKGSRPDQVSTHLCPQDT